MNRTVTSEEQLALTEQQIKEVCREIEELLISKNRSYGDSALNPVRIFSQTDPLEQIKVRIDDKLSRIISQPKAFGEDPVKDLLGYFVLLRIAQKRAATAGATNSASGPGPVMVPA